MALAEDITTRIDAITAIPEKYRHATIPAPRSVKIEITGRCNYRCSFCALRSRAAQPKADLDWDLFVKMTTEMAQAGVEEIGLFYLGESMMAPDYLVRAVEHCKAIGIPYVFLTSNGSLATPDRVTACMQAGLDSLKWSVNAADEAQFEEIMCVSAKMFRRALDNIAVAWDVRNHGGYRCKLYASSIRYDGEQQVRMEAMLERDVLPYVDTHYWLPLYSMGSVATQREEELGYRPTAGNQGRIGALREPLPCWSAFTEGHVRADGVLTACCFDADGRFAMGDLKTQRFMDAWNSPKFQALRRAHLQKDVSGTICEDCIAYA